MQESIGLDVCASEGATEGIQKTYHGRSSSRIPSEEPIKVFKAQNRSAEVLRLLDQIKRLTLHVPISKQCLTVPLWWPSSEGSESCESPVPKRRRLLGKTKVPSFALDWSLASTAERALNPPAVLKSTTVSMEALNVGRLVSNLVLMTPLRSCLFLRPDMLCIGCENICTDALDHT